MNNLQVNALLNEKLDTRWGIFKFKHAAMGFLLGVFVFPTYFGIDVGFDLTVLRIFEIILLVMIYQNKIRLYQFIDLIKSCKQNVFIAAYFIIVCYTNIIRGFAIKGIINSFTNWIAVFYLMVYLIKYQYGVNQIVRIIKAFLWIICLISIVELATGTQLFALLDTLGKSRVIYRFGSSRLSGHCTTPNGFGLYLMLLLPVAAYDEESANIDVLRNKWLVLLTVICALLTGSRLAAGAAVLEIVLLVLFSPPKIRIRTVFWGIPFLGLVAAFIFLLQGVPFFRSLLLTFFSAVDEVLGTEISVNYGANMATLNSSSHYRELMWRGVFLGGWLNPLLGQGTDYSFGMFIDGYLIQSTDNYYVGQYVLYAYPGLIAWLLMSVSFAIHAINRIKTKDNPVCIAIIITMIGYYISLWYLDQLQTFTIMMALFAIIGIEKNACERKP